MDGVRRRRLICITVGTLHDHVINFKVDLDVVSSTNSLLEKTTEIRDIAHPWLDEDWGPTTRQQFIKSRYIETEDDSRLVYPPNFRGAFAFVNKEELNSWGVPRGYGIYPGVNPIYNVGFCRELVWGALLTSWTALDCRWIEADAQQRQFRQVQFGRHQGTSQPL